MGRSFAGGSASCLLALLAGAGCLENVAWQREPWSMIQSVGGLRVDDPVRMDDGTVFLPVVCNVCGGDSITIRPTAVNSGLEVWKVLSGRDEDGIWIQVVTIVANDRDSSWTSGASLDRLPAGAWKVRYLNPDGTAVDVRTIRIPEP